VVLFRRYKVLLFLFVFLNVSAVDIGSDSAVTRFSTQQVLNNGDRIAGFAALEAGFALASSSVSATFDSFFEVSGIIQLQLGELVLNRDLIFRGISSFYLLGDIDGNHHVMEFSTSMTLIPDSLTGSETIYVFDLLAESDSQTADVETVDWVFSDTFISIGIDQTSVPTDILRVFHRVDDELFINDSISFAVKRTINSVRWHPDEYILAVCRNDAGGGQDELLTYTADSSTGVLTFIDGIDFSDDVDAIDWHSTGSWIAVGKSDAAEEIAVYAVTDTGYINPVAVATYNFSPSRYANTESISWDDTGDYLTVGTTRAGAAAELNVFYFNQAAPSLVLNASFAVGHSVLSVDFNKTYTDMIATGASALTGDVVEIYQHDATGGTLTKKVGISDFNKPANCVAWHPEGELLAIGLDPIVGGELRIYSYDNSAFSVSELKAFEHAGGVVGVRWSHDGQYLATGDDGTVLRVYGRVEASTQCVTFTDLDIILNNDLYLAQDCLHFSGENVILGRGNYLTFSPTTTIVLDPGASLEFKDIIVAGVKENNIRCLDDLCTVSLEDATYILDDDYSFTVGKLAILGNFEIVGEDKVFTYQTDQTSTISSTGRIIIDHGVTFSYDPPTASNDLISFDSDTSEIILNGGTLHATSTGMKFTTGRMIIDSRSALSSEGTVDAEAISFESDFVIQWMPAANLDLFGGNIVFDIGC